MKSESQKRVKLEPAGPDGTEPVNQHPVPESVAAAKAAASPDAPRLMEEGLCEIRPSDRANHA